jgi:predicted TIM-barrel fold metal-dependent hydrolase
MLPGMPATEFDYDDERFDPVWQACVDLKLPICFHVLTGGSNPSAKFGVDTRGTKVAHSSHVTIRLNQDLTALFIWGRVFERFPGLKMVCTEADAGWAPHFMYRMDHFYSRHRYWSKTEEMARMPSEYFRENIYLTFQDDWSAFRQVRDLNPQRLLWANDFPHSDSTWPVSREMLKVHTAELTEQQKRWILHDNTVELFGLELAQ